MRSELSAAKGVKPPEHIQVVQALPRDATGKLSMKDAEKQLLIHALQEADGNRTLAAQKLNISRRTLHRRRMRAAAQLIAYELPLVLAVVGVVVSCRNRPRRFASSATAASRASVQSPPHLGVAQAFYRFPGSTSP